MCHFSGHVKAKWSGVVFKLDRIFLLEVFQYMEKVGEFLLGVGCFDVISPSFVQAERLRRPLLGSGSANIVCLIEVFSWNNAAVKVPRTLRGVLHGPLRLFFARLSFFDFPTLPPTTVTNAPVSILKANGSPSMTISADRQSESSTELIHPRNS